MSRGFAVFCLVLLLLASISLSAHAQTPQQKTVSLFVFDARLRSFAPGIDGVVTLDDAQKKKLAGLYSETLGTTSVQLSESVLQDASASLAQRQLAAATVVQAQNVFRARSREILTEDQRKLIDGISEAFNRVYKQAQEDFGKQVTANMNKELEKLLTPEQKAAMAKKAAEIAAAQAKPAAAPATAPAQPAPK